MHLALLLECHSREELRAVFSASAGSCCVVSMRIPFSPLGRLPSGVAWRRPTSPRPIWLDVRGLSPRLEGTLGLRLQCQRTWLQCPLLSRLHTREQGTPS